MFKFKVGDKLVLKEEGITSGTGYDSEQLERLKKYGFIEVMDVGVGVLSNGYAVAMHGNYWAVNKLWVSKGDLEDYYVLKQEPKLTPKLIESLDELKVGDYFRTKYGEVINVMSVDKSCYYPIATNASAYNLVELQEMGAYKVKVEPYEMVEVKEEVEEVKPKLYELVEGQDYVKLVEGDVVKFLTGLELTMNEVDKGDTKHPYAFSEGGSHVSWIYSGFLVPENIIAINGANIHGEVTEKDPYEGWVEGAKVRCLIGDSEDYQAGSVYKLGYCNYEMGYDFGVLTSGGRVYKYGCLQPEYDVAYVNGDILKCFELIKE